MKPKNPARAFDIGKRVLILRGRHTGKIGRIVSMPTPNTISVSLQRTVNREVSRVRGTIIDFPHVRDSESTTITFNPTHIAPARMRRVRRGKPGNPRKLRGSRLLSPGGRKQVTHPR